MTSQLHVTPQNAADSMYRIAGNFRWPGLGEIKIPTSFIFNPLEACIVSMPRRSVMSV